MRKTDKKIENALVKALTQACDIAQECYPGFLWLTHRVNYHTFPTSLTIICVFSKNAQLQNINLPHFRAFIQETLAAIGIRLPKPNQQIMFDSEENCNNSHAGNWQQRLAHH